MAKERKCKIIGLTGGIGAGKSVVARLLRSKGYEVYDCDREAKNLMVCSDELVSALKGRFGDSCYHPDGSLDRKLLSRHIFSSEEHRLWVNALVHEAVRKDMARFMESRKGKILFVESAILHTSHLDAGCDAVWLIMAPEPLRFRRAMDRGGIEESDLRARMAAQEREFDLLECLFIEKIDNSGKISLLGQIQAALEKIECKTD